MHFRLPRTLFLLTAVVLVSCEQLPPRHIGPSPTATAPATLPAKAASSQAAPMISTDYTFMRFEPSENWQVRVDGPASAASFRDKTLTFDFSSGAKSIGLVPRDISMLGEPEEIRLRVSGHTAGRRVRLQLLSHFMHFERTLDPIPALAGDGEQVIRIPAPPGEGWKFFGGENDGKLHGPLRITGLFLDAERGGGAAASEHSGSLKLIAIEVKARCAANRAALVTARLGGSAEKPVFIANVHSQIAQPVDGSLDYVIRDWDGRTVATHSTPFRMDSARPADFSVAVPAGNHVFLEAEFVCRARGQQIAAATVCYLSPLPKGGSHRLQPESPWGMGLYLMRYQGDPELMNRAAAMAKDIGVKWSREEFSWAMIEPKRGEFDWRFFDRVVATAKANGISVYGLLDYWSPWTKPYTPEGIEDYCRYVRAVVERYKKDIHHWEVWNEPNIFFWQGPKDMYTDLLKAAYKTIKEVDPDAKVAGCSTSGIDFDFIDRVQKLGGPFDVLTIHPYRRNFVDSRFIKEIQDAANLVRQDGRPRPVWITEIGWGTHFQHNSIEEGPSVTPREQACRLVRVYVDGLASRVAPNISWYDFRNDGDNPLEWEHNFGIITQDFQPKPAYRAYATLVKMIGERGFHDQLDLGSGVLAFRFGDPAKDPVIVAWSLDQSRTVTLPAGRAMQVTNLMGESRPLPAKEGRVELRIEPLVPVFVSWQ